MSIRVSVEAKRGCGWRKPGGVYIVNDGPARDCCRFVIPLHRCPTCGAGFAPARGWTWVNGAALLQPPRPECGAGSSSARQAAAPCGLADPLAVGRCGLIWVGEHWYHTPADFNREAAAMGVSRKLPAVPRGFKVGQTWVLLAHRKATTIKCPQCDGRGALEQGASQRRCHECGGDGGLDVPGVFSAFVPTRIEKVVADDCSEEEEAAIRERGMEPVIVKRAGETTEMFTQ